MLEKSITLLELIEKAHVGKTLLFVFSAIAVIFVLFASIERVFRLRVRVGYNNVTFSKLCKKYFKNINSDEAKRVLQDSIFELHSNSKDLIDLFIKPHVSKSELTEKQIECMCASIECLMHSGYSPKEILQMFEEKIKQEKKLLKK